MALRNHFAPPLEPFHHWHSFHHAWATTLAYDLNGRLPERYNAEPNIQYGIEIDVAALDRLQEEDEVAAAVGGGVAVLAGAEARSTVWTASSPSQTLAVALLDDLVEVQVFHHGDGEYRLVGAIELISPSNKDRPASRAASVSKGASYVQQGIGLVIVDIVTNRRANLHDELLERLDATPEVPLDSGLDAASYRPVRRAGLPTLEVWQEPMAVGSALPIMPLGLPGHLVLPVDLPGTYDQTCRGLRVPEVGGEAAPRPRARQERD